VQDSHPLLKKLEASLSDTSDVFVDSGTDADSYFASLAEDIRRSACEPFPLTATVVPPDFPDSALGASISGQCVAHRAGYWLVYQPDQDRFYCFWGESPSNLGAHGVYGSPLYCWSA
jgi:hypothetical protein